MDGRYHGQYKPFIHDCYHNLVICGARSVTYAIDGSDPPAAPEMKISLALIKQDHARCFHFRCAKQSSSLYLSASSTNSEKELRANLGLLRIGGRLKGYVRQQRRVLGSKAGEQRAIKG